MTAHDQAFEMTTSNLRFGPGVTAEVGMDLAELGMKKVLVVTDPVVRELDAMKVVMQSLDDEGIDYEIYSKVRVEPNDHSFHEAIEFAKRGNFDSYVAIGGGSTIDTAKVANLYTTFPADFLTYVNAPIGAGLPVPGQLKPLIAIPTTAGTGSETTGVAIFDYTKQHAKTGIAHRRLRPTLGLVDPENTRTLPPSVIAGPGLDVLCHALESYTAIPFNRRPKPDRPILRPAYQGSNPISDIWSQNALKMVAEYLPRAYRDPTDEEARGKMLLASAYAGMGFGNAGVHLCHGMSYPISSNVRDYHPPGYPDDHPIVPHGLSVTLTAPAVFRFTASTDPQRHLNAARWLGANMTNANESNAGDVLANRLIELMRELGVPNGLEAIGFNERDIESLANGTLPQHRVTKLSPKPADESDLIRMLAESLKLW